VALNKSFTESLEKTIEQLKADKVYKTLNYLDSPQSAHVKMEGRGDVLILSSNNYLGLSDEPSIVQAGITQVDVIVSKEQASNDITLTFTRNALDESRAGTGAYENVSYVDRFDETLAAPHLRRYYLFHLDLDTATQLSLNSILVSPSTNTDAIFLLARSPYSTLDRYTDLVVELSGMDEERDYIKFYAVNSVTTARVTQTAISTIYPPLTLGKFAVEKTIKTQLPGVTEQITIDGAVITGPDA